MNLYVFLFLEFYNRCPVNLYFYSKTKQNESAMRANKKGKMCMLEQLRSKPINTHQPLPTRAENAK